jgi:hypothetical protein
MTKRNYIKAGLVAAFLLGALAIASFKSGLLSLSNYSSAISLVPAELNTNQAAEEKDIDDEGSASYFSIFRLINGLIPDQKEN